jgi:hypothetical protein
MRWLEGIPNALSLVAFHQVVSQHTILSINLAELLALKFSITISGMEFVRCAKTQHYTSILVILEMLANSTCDVARIFQDKRDS